MLIRSHSHRKLSVLCLIGILTGCGTKESTPTASSGAAVEISKPKLQLSSSAFENNARIADRHTAEGDDVSPPLAWSSAPDGTMSFALICDDPDAPSEDGLDEPWVHWVVYNIPATVTDLPEGLSKDADPAAIPGVRQGLNSWLRDNVGYRGPAPPSGSGKHRYFFKLYALDQMLQLNSDATKEDLVDEMSGHVLAEGELIGIFER